MIHVVENSVCLREGGWGPENGKICRLFFKEIFFLVGPPLQIVGFDLLVHARVCWNYE